MFGIGWGAVGGEALTDKERPPPAAPIPLEFPSYVPSRCGSPLSRRHIQSLCRDLTSVRRPLDVSDGHLAHLNIQLEQDVSLVELIPDRARFEHRPLLYDEDLTSMLTELEIDNEDAYREVLRLPPLEGRKRPRLAYSRNFFASLEDMSRYWDAGKDHYYEVEATEAAIQEATLPTRGVAGESHASPNGPTNANQPAKLQAAIARQSAEGSGAEQSGSDPPSADVGVISPVSPTAESLEIPRHPAATAAPKLRRVYKGHRLGNGEQMSAGTRVSTVRNLLKMAVHKFNCRDYEVSPRERFRVKNINIPTMFYSFCVARLPADVALARARMVEGPLLAVHCRNEVRFRSRQGLLGPTSDFVGEKFDLFREVGALLMLAKQRSREGQKLSKEPLDHQWWAIRGRWGGGATRWGQLASEVYEDEDPSWGPEERRLQLEKRAKEQEEQSHKADASKADLDNLKPEDLLANSGERPKKKKKSDDTKDKSEYRDGRRLMYTAPLRRKWYQEWLKIRPNSPNWDEKIIFRKVGRSDDKGWDDVWLVSAANHHVCILRMSVHERYLEWLDGGSPDDDNSKRPQPTEGGGPRAEHLLYLWRSAWFDLFKVDDRKEFLVGIWRILSWINRDEVPQEELRKMRRLGEKGQPTQTPPKHGTQHEDDAGDHQMEI